MRSQLSENPTRKRHLLRRLNFWLATITVASLGVGILSVLLTLFSLKDPEPGVTFETISDTNVLDLRRPLQDLSIDFRGKNIEKQNLNLRIITINIVNSGEVNILPSHYDIGDEWGVQFRDAEVIEARLVDTNSEYLKSKVVPQRLGIDTVVFPKVIFEQGDFFAIEVLLLHSKDAFPSVSSVGKIAGIDTVTVLARPLVREEVSFVTELFQGSAIVQIVRVIIYWFGSLLAIVLIILSLVGIFGLVGRFSARRRKSRILQTRTVGEMSDRKMRNVLIGYYEDGGISALRELRKLLTEPGRIKWVVPRGRWVVDDGAGIDRYITVNRGLDVESRLSVFYPALDRLMATDLLQRGDDDNALVDATLLQAVDRVVAELEG